MRRAAPPELCYGDSQGRLAWRKAMSVHFRIVSDDGNTLLDRELAKASGTIDLPAGEVLRVLDAASEHALMFVIDEGPDPKPRHKLPCDWSVLD
jgi:hypothetical protein